MKRTPLVFSALLCFLLADGLSLFGRECNTQEYTIDGVIKAAKADTFVLQSIHAEYTVTETLTLGRPQSRRPVVRKSTRSFSFLDDRFRWSWNHEFGIESWSYDGENSIFLQSRNERTTSATLHKGKHPRVSDAASHLAILGVCAEAPDESSVLFPFCLSTPEDQEMELKYEISGTAEINGHECIVLDCPEIDRLWVDPEVGYRVRRREVFGRSEQPKMERLIEYSGFELVNGRIWLPTNIKIVDFADETPDRTVTYQFHTLVVNGAMPEDFLVSLDEQTIIRRPGSKAAFRADSDIKDAFVLFDEH